MAIRKSDLYSSLWASCDELRGGMDASQYKDYVLCMLFIKYVSDRYGDSDDFAPPVVIPKGASFKDMVALKGKRDFGDRINKEVIAPLVNGSARLARSDFPDFNDPNKLGRPSGPHLAAVWLFHGRNCVCSSPRLSPDQVARRKPTSEDPLVHVVV
jgi:type I restriction enzyme M protein